MQTHLSGQQFSGLCTSETNNACEVGSAFSPSLPPLIILRDAANSRKSRHGEEVIECAETMFPENEKLCVLASQVSNYHYGVGWRTRVAMNLNPSGLERSLFLFVCLFILAVLHSMQHLISLTRDRTPAPCSRSAESSIPWRDLQGIPSERLLVTFRPASLPAPASPPRHPWRTVI